MTVRHGTVTTFDDHRGDGIIRDDAGATFYVHCVEIADGSRTVAVGARVAFLPTVGHLGRDEAARVQSIVA